MGSCCSNQGTGDQFTEMADTSVATVAYNQANADAEIDEDISQSHQEPVGNASRIYNILVMVNTPNWRTTYMSREEPHHWVYGPSPSNPAGFQIVTSGKLVSVHSNSGILSIIIDRNGVPDMRPIFLNQNPLQPPTAEAVIKVNQRDSVPITWFTCEENPNNNYDRALSFIVNVQGNDGRWQKCCYYFVPGSNNIHVMETSLAKYVFKIKPVNPFYDIPSPAVQIQVGNNTGLQANITNQLVTNGEYTNKSELVLASGGLEAMNVTGSKELKIRGSFQIEFPECGSYLVEFDHEQRIFTVKNEIEGLRPLFNSKSSDTILYGMISFLEESSGIGRSPSHGTGEQRALTSEQNDGKEQHYEDTHSSQSTRTRSGEILVVVNNIRKYTYNGNSHWNIQLNKPSDLFILSSNTSGINGVTTSIKSGSNYLAVAVPSDGVPTWPPTFTSTTATIGPSITLDDGNTQYVTVFNENSDRGRTSFSFTVSGSNEDTYYLYPNDGEIHGTTNVDNHYIFVII